jgi:GntR family transcriptional regulator
MFVFRLDSASGVPPYLQLVQQVRHALQLGFLTTGDQLPLIREVVQSLAINPNTVAKAYRQLEHEGVAAGRPGQGTFIVAEPAAPVSPATYSSLRRGLDAWLGRAYAAGLDAAAIDALFTTAHRDRKVEGVA